MPIDWSTFGVDLHVDLTASPEHPGRRAALERALRAAIRSGRLEPGARLPSTRALATELGLARGTVTAAYDQLVAEGYLSARTGSGTTVAAQARPTRSPRAPRTAAEPDRPPHDLRPGRPDLSSFPVADWLRAARRALTAVDPSTLDYGDPRGRPELRTALAEYLGRTRGVLADPDRIVITSGYVQALSLLTGVVRGPVALEDPGLPYHREVVRHAGSRVLPLTVDDRGARTDELSTTDAVAVVLTPAHQYPTGVTLQPDRRRAAVDWARAGGGLVIEDDYDGEFRYDRQPVGAMQQMAADQVAYVGSVSKTLGPSLRLGWIVAPARWVSALAEAKRLTDRHTDALGQLTLADLIRTHAYDRHVRAMRLRYRRRRDLLVERLRGLPLTLTGIAAGLHALIPLGAPAGTEDRVLAEAARRGLDISGLAGHWHRPEAVRAEGIIVGYGTTTDAAYPRAVDALAGVLTWALDRLAPLAAALPAPR